VFFLLIPGFESSLLFGRLSLSWKEKFKPCSGFLNHPCGDFLILMRITNSSPTFDPIPMEWKEHKSEKGTPEHPELQKKMAKDFANATPVSVSVLRLPHSAWSYIVKLFKLLLIRSYCSYQKLTVRKLRIVRFKTSVLSMYQSMGWETGINQLWPKRSKSWSKLKVCPKIDTLSALSSQRT